MYRMVDCGTWDDPWFAELEPAAKLLFLYLLTNRRSTPAGCFEITLRAIAFETGIQPERISALIPAFGERVRWWPEHQVIWLKNFYKRQMGDSANNPKFLQGARKALLRFPREVIEAACKEYPELTPAEDAPSPPTDTPTKGHTRGMEAPPIPSPKQVVVVTEKEKEPEESEPTVPADGDADGKTYALVDAWAVANQRRPRQIVGKERRDTAAIFKPLAGEYTAADVAGCVAWFKSDPFWQPPGKLTALKLVQSLPEWVGNGRPGRVEATGRASPSAINRNGAIDGMAKVRELEAKELRAS